MNTKCQRAFAFVMPAGKVRYISVHGKQLRNNIDIGERQPIVIVQENSLESAPLFFESVEILGPSELVVDYKRTSPHHPYSVACLKTSAALSAVCANKPTFDAVEIREMFRC